VIGEIETSRGGYRAVLAGVPFSVAAVLALGWPSGALAQAITEYALPAGYSLPVGITSGPDGALWFTDANGSTEYVGRITATASNPQITEYPVSTGYGAYYITTGADNNLWFTDTLTGGPTIAALGQITTGGTINEFNFPNGVGGAKEIVSGPDSALWFPQGGVMGHMTTGGTYSNFSLPAGANSTGVTVGPDNNIWFTDQGNNAIGRTTTGGSTTEFTIPTSNSTPQDITTGPDGNLWFTETTGNKIGRITTAGTITEFTIPTANSGVSGIVKKGRALWFTEPGAHQIGRLTVAGVGGTIAEFPTPIAGSAPTQIVAGSDGALWFVDANGNAPSIGRVQLPETAHDFNDDSFSDILWRDTSGNLAIWEMNSGTILNPSNSGLGGVPTNWSIVGQRDFNGDGNADILWRDTAGDLAIWEMSGTTILNPSNSGLGSVSTVWSIVGTGDFNGDGYADILWRNTTTGDVAIWEMNGTTILNPSSSGVGTVATNWTVVGVGDFNGDGKADILWQNTSNGNLAIYLMNGTTIMQSTTFANLGAYSVVGIGDFNGDGKADILLRDGSGDVGILEMNGTSVINGNSPGVGNLATTWSVAETGDFNGNGMADILWRDTSGDTAIWFMNGTTVAGGTGLGTISTTFTVQGTNAD
jgi:streptogramin lyase